MSGYKNTVCSITHGGQVTCGPGDWLITYVLAFTQTITHPFETLLILTNEITHEGCGRPLVLDIILGDFSRILLVLHAFRM